MFSNRFSLTRSKIVWSVILCIVVYNEWISFAVKSESWLSIPISSKDDVKVLFAADPQVLSTVSEPFYPFSILAIWDANRFISRGLHLAIWKVQPDMVIFLGDLLNDGSVIDDIEYQNQVHYFKRLLFVPSTVKHIIYIPGDNDVGGEAGDVASLHKIKRFYRSFNQSEVSIYKFLEFIQVNLMANDEHYAFKDIPVNDKHMIRILLSHIPLLTKTSKSIKQSIVNSHPNVIFSGHQHSPLMFTGLKSKAKANEMHLITEEKILEMNVTTESLYEIVVPTCSYRMGQKKYGFGYAVFSSAGLMQYTVLWMPNRFTHLMAYVISAAFIFMLFIPTCIRGSIRKLMVISCDPFGKFHRI